MDKLLIYLIVGLVTGSIYAVASVGLVLTYTTTRIFNIAHGAIGMIIAFVYYQMRVVWGWPMPVALLTCVLVIGPAIGVILDFAMMRKIQRTSIVIRLIATVALFTTLEGVALLIWGTNLRTLPALFPNGEFPIVGGLYVTYDQLTTVLIALVLAIGLRWLFHHTRVGSTMRAVVDDPSLAELSGIRPSRITALSWAMGASLAGLAAILIAPSISLDIVNLSLLVVSAYAAAVIGRLSSTALTFAGAMLLGILSSVLVGYLPSTNEIVQDLQPSMPFIVLFIALIVLKQERAAIDRPAHFVEPRPITLRASLSWGGGGLVLAIALAPVLSGYWALAVDQGLVYTLILLSLVMLTGMAGQISLAQFAFVGIGAALLGHLAGHMPYIVAVLVAVVATGIIGTLAALPALRLRGLYLALATLGFAVFMDDMVFPNSHVFGILGTPFPVPYPSFAGVTVRTYNSLLVLLAVVVIVVGIAVVALRRSRLGHALVAMRDAPVAASALGLNLTRTKLLVFFASAAVAGLGGCLYGALQQQVAASDFTYLNSLTLLLILAIQGMSSVTGAVCGGIFYGVLFVLLPTWITNPETIEAIQPFAIGLGVVNLAFHPEGAIAQQRAQFVALRQKFPIRQTKAVVSLVPTGPGMSASAEQSGSNSLD